MCEIWKAGVKLQSCLFHSAGSLLTFVTDLLSDWGHSQVCCACPSWSRGECSSVGGGRCLQHRHMAWGSRVAGMRGGCLSQCVLGGSSSCCCHVQVSFLVWLIYGNFKFSTDTGSDLHCLPELCVSNPCSKCLFHVTHSCPTSLTEP